ncbi:MAG: LptF/LptG family permease [Thermoguttaceae bacterium]|nr:LptF/LptG family permease [Thermoguttaceae bacterium]MDW8079205.1 LptF/LptG family permease [Thermoguttaceae bacterium]
MTRYVLGEMLKVLVAATAGIMLMMLLVGAGREAWEYSLPLSCTVRLLPYLLPDALRVGIPVALLLAVVTTFGRLGGFNELLAIKAAGISPAPILGPVLAVAFGLSLFTVWMNDLAASWGRQGIRQVVIAAAEDIVYGLLRLQHRFQQGRVTIQVSGVVGRRLLEPILVIYGSGDEPAITASAQEAELRGDSRTGTLRLTLRNGTIEVGGQARVQFPDTYEQEIRLVDKADSGRLLPPSWLPLRDIPAEVSRCLARIQEYRAKLADGPNRGSNPTISPGEQERVLRELRNLVQYYHRLRTEPFRRWAAGFSCLGFALVGSGMAIRLRQRELVTAFFLCFAPILVAYYPLLAWTVDAAKGGVIPPWGVWLGNVLCGVWGGGLLWQDFRH